MPASTSFVSTNGPSVTTSPRIEVAVSDGCNAIPATSRPPAAAMRPGSVPCASITSGGSSSGGVRS